MSLPTQLSSAAHILDATSKDHTVTAVTNNSTDTTPLPRYAALLKLLRSATNPMMSINGDAIRLSFTFDDDHHWVPIDPLMNRLSNEADRWLLLCESTGGRLRRNDELLDVLIGWTEVPDAVNSLDEWDDMIDDVEELLDAGGGSPRSFQTFAELVDEVLFSMQPPGEERQKSWVEAWEGHSASDTRAATFDWLRVRLESLMDLACVDVDRIVFSYPGFGHVAELVFEGEGRTEHLHLTTPATLSAAALMAHHYENVEPSNETPVMNMLNALSHERATAMIALAARPDIELFDPLDDHPATPAAMCDVWRLHAAVLGASEGDR